MLSEGSCEQPQCRQDWAPWQLLGASRAELGPVPSTGQTLPDKGKEQVVSKVSPGNPNEYSRTAGNRL